jgi:hypothetical protein
VDIRFRKSIIPIENAEIDFKNENCLVQLGGKVCPTANTHSAKFLTERVWAYSDWE